MSFQQLDEPWVKAEDVPAPAPSPFIPPLASTPYDTWQSTPVERQWFAIGRSVGRLDGTIDNMLVALEQERPGCMSPCSESAQGSFRLSEETTRQTIQEAWKEI